MTTLQTLQPHTPSITTHSVFGRRVKEGAEFEQFKKEVLATYKDSDINIKEEDIKREFCFTRKRIPIPLIGWLINKINEYFDGRRFIRSLKEYKKSDGERIIGIAQFKKWLAFDTAFIKKSNIKVNKIDNKIYKKMFKNLEKGLKESNLKPENLKLKYKIQHDLDNRAFGLISVDLKEKPEELQTS